MVQMRRILGIVIIGIFLLACSLASPGGNPLGQLPGPNTAQPQSNATPVPVDLATARDKIKHVVIIMQENRSFDSYFGTYLGADGLPVQNGKFTVCVTNPASGKCVYPYHDSHDLNFGGPHNAISAAADIDGGKMDGFIAQAESSHSGCQATHDPSCGGEGVQSVMGYHDARDIPN